MNPRSVVCYRPFFYLLFTKIQPHPLLTLILSSTPNIIAKWRMYTSSNSLNVTTTTLTISTIEKPSTKVIQTMNKYFVFVPHHLEREVEKDTQLISEMEAERQALVKQAQIAGELNA